MNKEFIKDSIYSFVRLFGILWLALLIISLGFNIILFFVNRTQVYVLGVIETILFFAITFTGCFLLSKSDGYKNNALFSKSELPKYAIVLMLHILYAFLFKFAIYSSGASYSLSHIIWRKLGHSIHGIGSAPNWLYLILLIMFDLLYLMAVIMGRNYGYKKRISDRKQLTGK